MCHHKWKGQRYRKRERERESDVKLTSNWQVKSEQHHHHRPFVYLRPRSRLYCPPYLHRFPASSVISGIQLANTAYIGYKNQQTTNQALSLTSTLWPSATVPTWNLTSELAWFSLLSISGVSLKVLQLASHCIHYNSHLTCTHQNIQVTYL
jgi:hypothetical protein